MRRDLVLRRSVPVVIAALLGLTAYFQARGLGAIVAASTLPTSSPTVLVERAAPPVDQSGHAMSADSILEHNPFDATSLTGNKESASTELGELPSCESARLVLTVVSDDADWSFASIGDRSGAPRLRRVGDEVLGAKIASIGWDHVVLSNERGQCRLTASARPTADLKAKPSESAPALSGLVAKVAAKIRRIDNTTFVVERSVIDTVLEHQAELFGKLRVSPDKDGVRLNGIRPDNVLGLLGLVDGDRLGSINGFQLSDPQRALEAYTRLRSAEHLTLSITRGGRPVSLNLDVQ
jgi:general secretion pathway protein C